jgi:hypothetical protein
MHDFQILQHLVKQLQFKLPVLSLGQLTVFIDNPAELNTTTLCDTCYA